ILLLRHTPTSSQALRPLLPTPWCLLVHLLRHLRGLSHCPPRPRPTQPCFPQRAPRRPLLSRTSQRPATSRPKTRIEVPLPPSPRPRVLQALKPPSNRPGCAPLNHHGSFLRRPARTNRLPLRP